jgi:hypothetical protein
MPVVIGTVRFRFDGKDAGGFAVVLMVKEKQLDSRRVPRIKTEIDAGVAASGAQGRTSAGFLGEVHAAVLDAALATGSTEAFL